MVACSTENSRYPDSIEAFITFSNNCSLDGLQVVKKSSFIDNQKSTTCFTDAHSFLVSAQEL